MSTPAAASVEIDKLIEGLDLESKFLAAGRSWVELNAEGQVVQRNPERVIRDAAT